MKIYIPLLNIDVSDYHHDREVRHIIHLIGVFLIEFIIMISLVIANIKAFNTRLVQATVSPITEISEPQMTITPFPVGTVAAASTKVVPTTIVELFPTPTRLTAKSKLSKKNYTVVLIGDSIVDTMGEVCEYLDKALKNTHPDTSFLCYNYGVGSQNITEGLARFHSRFDYQTRHYPPISEIKPDIIILGSFAYNVLTPHSRDQHWNDLTRLVREAQTTGASVYLLAEIAPRRADFGKGPQGVNWENNTTNKHSENIKERIENVLGLAKSLNIPLIDTYTPSLLPGQKEVVAHFINPSDGIHPSVLGHQFMAGIIASTIVFR